MLEWTYRVLGHLRSERLRRKLDRDLRSYVEGGLRFGTRGYEQYKLRVLREAVTDTGLLGRFLEGEALPAGHGAGVDERIVEYPWVLTRLGQGPMSVLDAGSALNFDWIADSPLMRGKGVLFYTLAPEGILERPDYSYVYGDLRATILRDEIFDRIVSISTLEHVGMDNTAYYATDPRWKEHDRSSYRLAVRELRRMLRPGGRLLLTVPYGRRQDLGWMQQFDAASLDDLVAAFGGNVRESAFFRYTGTGWVRADAAECADAEYVYATGDPDAGIGPVARATAVACLDLEVPA